MTVTVSGYKIGDVREGIQLDGGPTLKHADVADYLQCAPFATTGALGLRINASVKFVGGPPGLIRGGRGNEFSGAMRDYEVRVVDTPGTITFQLNKAGLVWFMVVGGGGCSRATGTNSNYIRRGGGGGIALASTTVAADTQITFTVGAGNPYTIASAVAGTSSVSIGSTVIASATGGKNGAAGLANANLEGAGTVGTNYGSAYGTKTEKLLGMLEGRVPPYVAQRMAMKTIDFNSAQTVGPSVWNDGPGNRPGSPGKVPGAHGGSDGMIYIFY